MMRSAAAESHLHKNLEQFAFSPDGLPMRIYGDLADPVRFHLSVDTTLIHLCLHKTSA